MNNTKELESKNIDGYLGIVFDTQFTESGRIANAEHMLDSLEKVLSENLDKANFDKAYSLLWDGFSEVMHYIGVEAMKMAIGIENGTYGVII